MARTSTSASDAALVAMVRRGDDSGAYAELWRRHSSAAYAVARSFTSLDADDVVAEAFTRILATIRAGGGPTMGFRAYLLTSTKNVAREWGSRHGLVDATDLEDLADPAEVEDSAIAAIEAGATASAFRSLPTRWQEALWYSEVENLKPRHFAPLLGLTANAASALVVRARQGFRDAWIARQLKAADDPECRATLTLLGARTRGALSTRDERKVGSHLETCVGCALAWEEAQHVSGRLALVLLPLVVGVPASAAYAAWTQTVPTGGVVALGAGGAGAPGMPAVPKPRPGAKTLATTLGAAAAAAVIVAGGIAFALSAPTTETNATGENAAGESGGTADDVSSRDAPALTLTTPVPSATPTPPAATAPETAPEPEPGPRRALPGPGPGPVSNVTATSPSPAPGSTTDPTPAPTPIPTPPPDPAPPLAAPTMSVDTSSGPFVYPRISGADAQPLATVEILDQDGRIRATTTAGPTGAWEVDDLAGGVACATDPDAYLPAGTHTLSARQLVGGDVSPLSASKSITVAAPPTLVSPVDGDVFPSGSFVLEIAANPDSLVQRIKLPDPAPCRPDPMGLDAAGHFTQTFSIVDAPGVPVTIGVRYVDAAGRHGPAVFVTISKS